MEGADYVKKVMRPLAPVPTGMEPLLPELKGISTVVFDIYGTLLISAAGDIGSQGKDEAGRLAMREVDALVNGAIGESTEAMADELVTRLHEVLFARRARGIQFPEVDVRMIWRELLEKYASKDDDNLIDAAVLCYECAVNPVWEMPGSLELIHSLAQKGIKLGIISNAQDYTRTVFAGVMGGSFESLGFDPKLGVFSYLQGEGKPSPALYEEMKARLSDDGVSPESVLYIGNDMRKDVVPAAEVGFRTCLFAGDARSLRLGEFSAKGVSTVADAIVTKMSQVSGLLK